MNIPKNNDTQTMLIILFHLVEAQISIVSLEKSFQLIITTGISAKLDQVMTRPFFLR